PVTKLTAENVDELRRILDRDARRALLDGVGHLRRWAWLDWIALIGILLAGTGAAVDGAPSAVLALEVLAGALLWLSNWYGVRSIITQLVAGSTALMEGIVEGHELLPKHVVSTDASS